MNTTTPATFGGKTADEWRAEESACYRRKQESWERSDTDGFLSQWAADQMAGRYARLAKIAEAGGIVEDRAFVDIATGELIKGTWEQGKYGAIYVPADQDRRIIFASHAANPVTRERNNAAKGVREVRVLVPVLLNHRSMETYVDVDGNWVVIDEEVSA